MIYLIAVPHQMPAHLLEFSNNDDIVDYANTHSDSVYDDIDEAKHYITHDWNSGIWIENNDDLKYALTYEGHQQFKVRAIASELIDKGVVFENC